MTPDEREDLVRALSNRGIRCACVALVEGGLITIETKELIYARPDVANPA